MDCDRVFMILTRGPFPTGDPSDEAVEAHLEQCADCWRLAEALRPALEVFQEAVPPVESRDLPGYWGDARPASHVLAELSSGTVRTALAAHARRIRASQSGCARGNSLRHTTRRVLRVAAVAATITAIALALMLLLRG